MGLCLSIFLLFLLFKCQILLLLIWNLDGFLKQAFSSRYKYFIVNLLCVCLCACLYLLVSVMSVDLLFIFLFEISLLTCLISKSQIIFLFYLFCVCYFWLWAILEIILPPLPHTSKVTLTAASETGYHQSCWVL